MKKEKHKIGLILAALVTVFSAPAYAERIEEAQLKAAMLIQFPFDVKWPAGKAGPDDINICLVGGSKIGELQPLFNAASQKFKRNYKLQKRAGVSALDSSCHIAYFSDSDSVSKSDLEKLASQAILTVSDAGGFAAKGGIVEFTPLNNKVKIGVINRHAAEAGKIFIAAGLLELALKVVDE